MANDRIQCVKCGKTKRPEDFFMLPNHTRDDMCKSCLTMYIDNKDPNTFMWILEKFDKPYVPKVWDEQAAIAYKKNPSGFGSHSVIGNYLRCMKLGQYKDMTFADTDKLMFEAEKAAREHRARIENDPRLRQLAEDLQRQLDNGEISEAEFNARNPYSMEFDEEPAASGMNALEREMQAYSPINEDDIRAQLTQEDIQHLSLKWGISYKPSQWVKMEDLYNEYDNDFMLNTIDLKETVKQICKVKVKSDECLEIGDMNGYKALMQVEGDLRKSGKFTKQQTDEGKKEYLDSIGELVAFCEREGGIIEQFPYPDDYPRDDVDFAIKDMKAYYRDVVVNELGLGGLIESYIQRLEQDSSSGDDDIYTTAEEEMEAAMMAQNDEERAAMEYSDFIENELEDQILRIAEGKEDIEL